MSVRIFSTLVLCGIMSSATVLAQGACHSESPTTNELSIFMEDATKASEVVSQASTAEDREQLKKRIQELMKQMLTADSELERAMAVYELKEIDSPIVPHALKKALKDKSGDVRLAALTSLFDLSEFTAQDSLFYKRDDFLLSKSDQISLLKTDPSSEVRQMAAWTLMAYKNEDHTDLKNVISALKESADKDESPNVRQAASYVLTMIGIPDPLPNEGVPDEALKWQAPAHAEKDVFIRSTFMLDVEAMEATSWGNVSDVVRLYPQSEGPDAAVELTTSFPQFIDPKEPSKGARFVFKPREALKPHTTYVLAPAHMAPEDVGTSKASVIFTTGDELGSTAKPADQSYPHLVYGLPRQLQKIAPQALTRDASGKLKMDWSAFESRMREGELHKELGSRFLENSFVPSTQQIVMEFNDAIDSSTAKEAIRIYDTLSGESIDTEALDIQVNENEISVSAGANGFVPNRNYILVVGQSLKTKSGGPINGTYATAFSTGSN